MPVHLVVDGSNIATEGRTHPSIHQLREAVQALSAEHPAAKITVVVDATFGHRIDPAEVPEFDAAVANNELVAPPAGAIGRGDAFVLGIADKVNGSILSNDSYQEFHGQHAWLFDEGRLIGGKPVPHVGWVFVNRLPVRGPLSRKSVSEAKRKGGRAKGPTAPVVGDGSVRVGSMEANKPMPVPTAPPPGAVLSRAAKKAADAAAKAAPAQGKKVAKQARATSDDGAGRAVTAPAERATPHEPLNDQLAFLSFVAEHPVGAAVEAVVDHYSSHGAYVRIGAVRGYVPLRLMGTPAPTSARSAMKIGETVQLVVHQYVAAKRSIDLAVAGAGTGAAAPSRGSATSTAGLRKVAAAVEPGATPGRASAKKVSPAASRSKKAAVAPTKAVPAVTTTSKASPKRGATASSTATSAAAARPVAAKKATPAKKAAPAKKVAPAKKTAPATTVAPAKKVGPAKKVAPAKKTAPATTVAPSKKVGPAKKAAPAKAAPTKKAAPSRAASTSRSKG
jgi:hypothetical protein